MIKRKGIILAGGTGSRLFPLTRVLSKQLVPVYNKPMIYYPLSNLIMMGIEEIAIIVSKGFLELYRSLLGDGSDYGVKIEYLVQDSPDGLPQAYLIAEEFLDGAPSALILGDNLFFGYELPMFFSGFSSNSVRNVIFAHHVSDPSDFGVVEFDEFRNVVSLEEKPKAPKSNFAITGLYLLDSDAPKIAKTLKKSRRGEFEIIDLLKVYCARDELSVEILGRGFAWFDGGTPDNLVDASNLVMMIKKRQGYDIGCIEEVALRFGKIDRSQFSNLISRLPKSSYREYLEGLL